MGQDVDQVGQVAAEVIPVLFRVILGASFTLVIMFILNPRMTLVVLPLILMVILVLRRFYPRLRRCCDDVQDKFGKVNAFLQEHLSSIVQVQLLSREIAESRRFTRLSRNAMEAEINRKKAEMAFYVSTALVIFGGVRAVPGYGGYRVIHGSMSVGGLVAFYTYMFQLLVSISSVVDVYSKTAARARKLAANPGDRNDGAGHYRSREGRPAQAAGSGIS